MRYILYYGLAMPAISLLIWLLVGDYRNGSLSVKQPPSRIRLLSLALFVLLSAVDICTGPGKVGAGSVLLNLQMSGVILLLSPHSYEKKKDRPLAVPAAFASLCLLTSLSLALVGDFVWKTRLFPVFAVTGLVLHNFLSLRRRFKNVRALFQNRSAWHSIEDYAGHCYVILLLSSICLVQISSLSQPLISLAALLPSLAILCVAVYGAYRKSMDSSIIFLSEKQCLQIRNIMNGNVVERTVRSKSRKEALFAKIEKYMRERQPFLEEGFSLSDLADAMLSNRVSVSKAINEVSGDNFSNLVNRYRIMHSQMLWKLNPDLRLKEIYSTCGFHNVASFINAFKEQTGYTPVEWLKETQVAKLSATSTAEELAA